MTIEKNRKTVNDTRHGGGTPTQAEVARALRILETMKQNRPLKPPGQRAK